jgi:hypothetical protein
MSRIAESPDCLGSQVHVEALAHGDTLADRISPCAMGRKTKAAIHDHMKR